ncbi:hypothetical protein [Paraburkholderia sp. J7]|uniref:hypothetical protein n=1 Tax=Paraburkholderia sp. J7 TaxID=2805438 RepID=UPI002AB62168|nr:hypothetical protein [Paraburkholderia sp. J7]
MNSDGNFLTRDQACAIIQFASSEESVLIGGQAVVFWAEHFGIPQPFPVHTRDIGFYGGKEAIVEAASRLQSYNPRVYMAAIDDTTPNSGRIAVDVRGLDTPCEIDFMYLVKGLSSTEVLDKAIRLSIDGIEIKVLHPLLLVESKLTNVATSPRKRDAASLAEARLSIEVARHFIASTVDLNDPRATLNMVKRELRFANTDEARCCWYHFDLDVVRVVPANELRASPEPTIKRFATEDMPIDLQRLDERRARYRNIVDRQKAFEASRQAAPQPSPPVDNRPSP